MVAASQILRITVTLNGIYNGAVASELHPWIIPEHLDLTYRQVNNRLPLQYTLSSAIARGGSHGMIETG